MNRTQALEEVTIIEHAIFNVNFAAGKMQELTHEKHFRKSFIDALNLLDIELTVAKANLSKYEKGIVK